MFFFRGTSESFWISPSLLCVFRRHKLKNVKQVQHCCLTTKLEGEIVKKWILKVQPGQSISNPLFSRVFSLLRNAFHNFESLVRSEFFLLELVTVSWIFEIGPHVMTCIRVSVVKRFRFKLIIQFLDFETQESKLISSE